MPDVVINLEEKTLTIPKEILRDDRAIFNSIKSQWDPANGEIPVRLEETKVTDTDKETMELVEKLQVSIFVKPASGWDFAQEK
jgi:hypothetical protein